MQSFTCRYQVLDLWCWQCINTSLYKTIVWLGNKGIDRKQLKWIYISFKKQYMPYYLEAKAILEEYRSWNIIQQWRSDKSELIERAVMSRKCIIKNYLLFTMCFSCCFHRKPGCWYSSSNKPGARGISGYCRKIFFYQRTTYLTQVYSYITLTLHNQSGRFGDYRILFHTCIHWQRIEYGQKESSVLFGLLNILTFACSEIPYHYDRINTSILF